MFQLRTLGLLLVFVAALAAPGSALAAPPANDNFAAAELLSGRVASVEGNNKDATKEDGELPHFPGRPATASVWYSWTAPADGRTHINTCDRPDAAFDTVLAVYTGNSFDALTAVANNDDGCGFGGSSVSFDADAGVTYRIAVDSVGGTFGFFILSLRLAPPNDDFDDAESLTGNEGSVDGTTVGSSREAGEPDYLYQTVWYRWTAPSSGPATFEICGSDLEAYLLAFTGDDVAELAYVSEGGCRLAFDAIEGVTYSIAINSYENGDFVLSWNRNPLPPFPFDYPGIGGLAQEGQTLTALEGAWGGTPPFSFSYAWGRCDADYDRCDLIGGATAKTYLLTAADVGQHVYVRVTATNGGGSATEYSDTTQLVRAAGPRNGAPPVVSGTAIVGEALIASDGTWTGPQPIRFAYQWQACDAAGSGCVNLQGDILSFIELRPAHVGKRLRVVVTATNIDGSRSATSEASAVVVAAKVTPPVRCVVPNVRGRSLKQAKSRLRRAHCRPGRIVRAFSASVRRGRVISQSPRPGARMKQGTRIKLVVSKGRKR
jgi:PASTA domain